KNQIEAMKVQSNAQIEDMKRRIEEFEASVKMMAVQVKAQEVDATIDYKRVDTMGKELDNAAKMKDLVTPDITKSVELTI
ncbi:MAG: hypothetical protein GY847_00265, partial [Proteobacteria bacterium]|nr:hypothetical protein [Pseudomonadota bacterium]